jgi:segregation and condensation protein A
MTDAASLTEVAAFAEDSAENRGSDEPTLIVDVEGFEGPLDLLLTLARQQKVDLARISILALADQYLAFVEQARKMRLELAADYLVMAAWLAYLKSRMLLPEPVAPEGLSAADMAKALALRLKRLDAIREAGARLFERPLLGRDVFERGDTEPSASAMRCGGFVLPSAPCGRSPRPVRSWSAWSGRPATGAGSTTT